MFFSWINFPQAPEYPIRAVRICSKIRGDIYLQVKVHRQYQWHRRTPVSMTPATNFAAGTAGVIDTSGKFTTGVVDTRQFCWYQRHERSWWKNLPSVSLKPMANFPPMSLILMVHHDLRISPWVFEQNRNGTSVFFRGLGEDDSWKKLKAKNLMAMSLPSVLLLQRLERNSVDLWIKEGNS